mgnify:CR=1 FL=1
MSLDSAHSMEISDAFRAASKYSEDTFMHVMRVASIVARNRMIPADLMNDCLALAIMHDILEETDFKPAGLPENFRKALELLTKPDDVTYEDYCKNIKDQLFTLYGQCAYWVKLADMKDYLTMTDTLTDKLKEKYLSGLRYLL